LVNRLVACGGSVPRECIEESVLAVILFLVAIGLQRAKVRAAKKKHEKKQ